MGPFNIDDIPPSAIKPSEICRAAQTADGLLAVLAKSCDELVGLSPWALAAYVKAAGKDYAVATLNYIEHEEANGRQTDAERLFYYALNDAIFGHGATGYGVSPDYSTDDLLAMADRNLSKPTGRNEYAWPDELCQDIALSDAFSAAFYDLSRRLHDEQNRNKCRLVADFIHSHATLALNRRCKKQGGAA